MAVTAGTELRRPDRYEDFETRCMALGKFMINSPNVTKNGRRGQAQKGVDVWGYRDGMINHVVGIQCKLKSLGYVLTEDEVRDEWKAALTFDKNLKEFFILTTAENDGKMEQLARELASELFEKEGRTVQFYVWGWGRINDEVVQDASLVRIFDPDYGVFSTEHSGKLDGVIEAQSRSAVKLESVTSMLRLIARAVNVDGLDETVGGSEVDKALNSQIDGYRSILQEGLPKKALSLFERMLADVQNRASPSIVFRITANIGACYLALEDISAGCEYLLAAYEHAPQEPKAIANQALAYLLLNDFEKVLEIGRLHFEPNLAHEDTWGHVVQAAAKTAYRGDPLDLVPPAHRYLETVAVAVVHFERLREDNRWWDKAAHTYSLHPDNRYAKQFYADSILDQIGKVDSAWATNAVPEHLKQKLESAVEIYQSIWAEEKKGENVVGDDALVVLANLFVALRLANRFSDANALIEAERCYIERDQDTLLRAAIVSFEGGSEFANELLPLLEAGPATSMLKIQLALRKADWSGIAEMSDELVASVEAPEKPVCRVALEMCRAWKAASGLPTDADLQAPIDAVAGDPRASILAADLCQAWGATVSANKAWENGRGSVTSDLHWTSRVSVAKHAYRLGRFRDAVDLYLGAIDLTVDSFELRQLTGAIASEVPQTGRGAKFFNGLPPALLKERFYRQYEAAMLFNSGDMKRAEKAARAALDDFRTLDMFRLLVATLHRSDRQEKIKGLLKTYDVLSLEGTPGERMFAAQVLHRFGRVSEALSALYDLYLANRNNPDIAFAFFVTMVQQSSFKHIPRPSTVSSGAWVLTEDDFGHRFAFIVGDEGSVGNDILPTTHSFVAAALGKKVGDSFSVQREIGGESVWTVREIRHRWSHAAADIGKNFETRFPDEKGVYSFTMKDDDIQPMLDVVKRQAEINLQFAQQYADGLPLSFVSGSLKRDPISFADYIRSLGRDIETCLGNAQERVNAYQIIGKHGAAGAVLDTYTAWTAASLDLLPTLKALFGSLMIPQSVKDELLVFRGFEKPHGKAMSVVYHDGQYWKHEITREEVFRRRNYIAEQIAKIEEACELMPVSAPAIEGEAVRERNELLDSILDSFGSNVLDPAAIAAAGHVLLSEDMKFRNIANTIWPIQSTWLQPALTTALANGLISFSDYTSKLVDLSRLRHDFLSFGPEMLVECLRAGDQQSLSDFNAAADFIGTAGADIHSHINVTSAFVDLLLSEDALPYTFRLKAVSILLGKLIRNQPEHYGRLLVGVVVGCGMEGKEVVIGWIKGHCVMPEVEERYWEYCQRMLPYSLRAIFQQNSSLVGNVWRLSSSRPIKLPPAFARDQVPTAVSQTQHKS